MADITLSPATETELAVIQQLAYDIWWPTYGSFIPHAQIRLMLEQIYTVDALKRQVATGGHFVLARQSGVPVGFTEYRAKTDGDSIMRIEKLYVSPHSQGQGVGRRLIAYVAERSLQLGKTHLELNVNRRNEPAIGFYRRHGFVPIAEVDTPYHGYVLDDYVMQKPLTP